MRGAAGGFITIGLLIGGCLPSLLSSNVSATLQSTARAGIEGVVTTKARPPRPIRVTFDEKVCGGELPDHAIVVDGAGRLANVVVTLVGVKAAAPPRSVTVVNEHCAFVPRVQVAGAKATMKTSSKDAVLHTTTVQLGDGRQLFNLALPIPGLELSKPLQGAGPLRVGCSTHQWMRAWIFVTDEVAVVTGPDGRFTLSDLAVGTYQLRVWHESLRAPDQTVTVTAGKPAVVNVELK